MRNLAIFFALCAIALGGCAPSVAERCAKAKDPQECATYANAGGDVSDYLLYGMAGYLIGQNSGGSYVYRDPGYRGSYPALRSPIGTRDQQVRKLERKVAAQKAELKRQQAANARHRAEQRRFRSSPSYSRPSYSRPSYSGGGYRRR